MAAVATKKVGSDLELQLSFPTQFEEAYAEMKLPTHLFPSAAVGFASLPAGEDLWAQYHLQKRADAHRSVMNGVRDTRASTNRAMASHQGYFGMPKPVLSQRIFANPSLGSGGIGGDLYSARRTAPQSGAPFHCQTRSEGLSGAGEEEGELVGGVLRSKIGQKFGKQLLLDRLAQFNAIDVAKAAQMTGEPMSVTTDPEFQTSQGVPEVADATMIRAMSLLQLVITSLRAGVGEITRLGVQDLTELVTTIIAVAPKADREELEGLLEGLDDAKELGRAVGYEISNTPAGEGGPVAQSNRGLTRFVIDIVNKLREYVVKMVGVANLNNNERAAASRAFVRSLGLTKYTRALPVPKFREPDVVDALMERPIIPPGRRRLPGAAPRGPGPQPPQPPPGGPGPSMLPPGFRPGGANAAAALGYRPEYEPAAFSQPGRPSQEPAGRFNVPGPQRFAAQGQLGYFGEPAPVQPAGLIQQADPFRQGPEFPAFDAARQRVPQVRGFTPISDITDDEGEPIARPVARKVPKEVEPVAAEPISDSFIAGLEKNARMRANALKSQDAVKRAIKELDPSFQPFSAANKGKKIDELRDMYVKTLMKGPGGGVPQPAGASVATAAPAPAPPRPLAPRGVPAIATPLPAAQTLPVRSATQGIISDMGVAIAPPRGRGRLARPRHPKVKDGLEDIKKEIRARVGGAKRGLLAKNLFSK